MVFRFFLGVAMRFDLKALLCSLLLPSFVIAADSFLHPTCLVQIPDLDAHIKIALPRVANEALTSLNYKEGGKQMWTTLKTNGVKVEYNRILKEILEVKGYTVVMCEDDVEQIMKNTFKNLVAEGAMGDTSKWQMFQSRKKSEVIEGEIMPLHLSFNFEAYFKIEFPWLIRRFSVSPRLFVRDEADGYTIFSGNWKYFLEDFSQEQLELSFRHELTALPECRLR